jgi:hypothetical protein
VEQGEKLNRVLLRSCTILNFDISLGRAVFGKNFDIDMGGGATLEERESSEG